MLKNAPYNEQKLLALIAQGDEFAFAKLFEYHRDRIYTVAFRISHSTTIAEEIVQDVFLKIWLMRADLIGIQNFSAYLSVVTRNNVYKVLKRIAKDYEITLLDDQLSAYTNSEDLVMDKEYNLLLREAIDRLPSQQKKVYQYIKEEGFKREETAVLLHLSPETVKFHLSQAMKNIRTFCMQHLAIFIGFIILLFTD